jgi:hypothetical protein
LGIINSFGQCTFDAVSDVKPTEIHGVDDRGNKITIPIEPIPGLQPIASIYRIRCDKLAAKSEIEVVLGLLSFSFGKNNPVGPRTKSLWALVHLNYEGRGRVRDVTDLKYFSGEP